MSAITSATANMAIPVGPSERIIILDLLRGLRCLEFC